MSAPLDITDEEAEGLARLAQAQLRLATRLSERALDESDAETACHLARASERVARGYRQSLLLKSRLRRDRDAVEGEGRAPPQVRRAPRDGERDERRAAELYGAIERIAFEQGERLTDQQIDDLIFGSLAAFADEKAEDDHFLDRPFAYQLARLCERLGLPAPPPRAAPPEAAAPPDSS